MQRRILPAQILRGLLLGVALYPLRKALLEMGRWGGPVIALLLLLMGFVAGISGLVEGLVFTTTVNLSLDLAHLPGVVV